MRKRESRRTDLSGLVSLQFAYRAGAGFSAPNYAERASPPLSRGYSAQALDVNSSESCTWKVRFISSNLPESRPEKLKSQAHSEQPHPRKLCPSTHTTLRDELCLPLWGIQPSQCVKSMYLSSGLVIPSLVQPRHRIQHQAFFHVGAMVIADLPCSSANEVKRRFD